MGIRNIFGRKNEPPAVMNPDPQTVRSIVDAFTQATAVPCVTLTAARRVVGITGSKLGGKPYMPGGFAYPCDRSGKPLRLLAQLNFAELPKLENYPKEGILQFFVRDDDLMGMAEKFHELDTQDGFRIIYHKGTAEESASGECPDLPPAECFPFQGELALAGTLDSCAMTSSDHRFNDTFMKIYKKHTNSTENSFFDIDDDIAESVFNSLAENGIRIGGYPYFTQSDPREDKTYHRYDTLLLQIDSGGDGEEEIMWGDCGVAGFFINAQDLKACDFSKVLYTWDCC